VVFDLIKVQKFILMFSFFAWSVLVLVDERCKYVAIFSFQLMLF